MNKFKYLFIIFIAIIFSNCTKEEFIPAYIYIEPFDLVTSANQGSDNHKILDAYVYVGGEYIGAFPLPATVPILKYGEQEIIVQAGIHENGISNAPIVNPCYSRFETTINLVEMVVDTITPTISYGDVEFLLVDDFQNATYFSKSLDLDPLTNISLGSNGNFEGNSGEIHLQNENDTILVASNATFVRDPNSEFETYFVEMNYKSESIIRIGLIGINKDGQDVDFFTNGVNPSDDWNKIYFNLSLPIIGSELEFFQIFLESSLAEGQTESQIFIDNFKLIKIQN